MTDLQRLADRLNEAMKAFAEQNGDDFGNPDDLGARDHRDEGCRIAKQAMSWPAERRDQFIDQVLDTSNPYGLDVIAAAAWYRLAELSK